MGDCGGGCPACAAPYAAADAWIGGDNKQDDAHEEGETEEDDASDIEWEDGEGPDGYDTDRGFCGDCGYFIGHHDQEWNGGCERCPSPVEGGCGSCPCVCGMVARYFRGEPMGGPEKRPIG